MRRLALIAVLAIALLGMIIQSRPVELRVRDLCFQTVLVRGLDVSGSSASIEEFEGYWTLRGEAQGRRWSCTVQAVWWGLRMEDVTVYSPGE